MGHLGLWLGPGQVGRGSHRSERTRRAGGRGWQLSGWHPKATHPLPVSVSSPEAASLAVPASRGPQAGAALTPSLLLKAGLSQPDTACHLRWLSPGPRAPGGSARTWIHALPSACGAPSVCHSAPPPACPHPPVLHTRSDATASSLPPLGRVPRSLQPPSLVMSHS